MVERVPADLVAGRGDARDLVPGHVVGIRADVSADDVEGPTQPVGQNLILRKELADRAVVERERYSGLGSGGNTKAGAGQGEQRDEDEHGEGQPPTEHRARVAPSELGDG